MSGKKELKLVIKTDAKTGELKVYQGELGKLDKAAMSLSKSIKKSATSVEKFTNTIKGLATAGVAIYALKQLSDAAIALGGSFIKTGMEFEKFTAVLSTIEGSSQQAQKSMQWIVDFTQKTPYQLAEVTESFVKLRAYGLEPTKGLLKTLGDTAAAMGKPLEQAVEAIADAVNGEFERLKEFGIKAYNQGDKVAFQWANASGKVKHIVVQNNQEIIQSTLEAIWNSKFEGAAQKRAQTLEGILSNMRDNWTKFKISVLQSGVYNYVKSVTRVVGEELAKTLADNEENVQKWANFIIDGIKKTVKAVAEFAKSWHWVKVAIKSIEIAWKGLKSGIFTGIQGMVKFAKMVNSALPERWQSKWINKINETAFDKLAEEARAEVRKALDEFVDLSLEKTKDYDKIVENFLRKVDIQYKKFSSNIKKATEKTTKEVKGAVDGAVNATSKATQLTFEDIKRGWQASAQKYKLSMNLLLSDTKKTVKETAKYTETAFDRATQNIYKSFDDNFFSAITGKFHDFKDFLRSLFRDILNSIINPFARYLSSSLSGALMGAIGMPVGAGGVSIAQSLTQAGFQAVSDGVFKNALGQQVKIAGGQVQAFDASGNPIALSSVSGLPSGIGTVSNAAAFLSNPAGSLANYFSSHGAGLSAAGYSTLGGMSTGYAAWWGGGTPMTTAQSIGYYGGGALTGAAMGYGMGKLGDAIFGTQTRAGEYGAIGGAIGSIGGPLGAAIGSAIGSAIGGMFARWKVKNKGLMWTHSIDSTQLDQIFDFVHSTKKSWFDGSSKTDLKGLKPGEIEQIKAYFKSYENLLTELDKSHREFILTFDKAKLIVDKNKNKFQEYVVKEFLAKMVGLDGKFETLFKEGAKRVLKEKDWGTEAFWYVAGTYEKRMKDIDKLIAEAPNEGVRKALKEDKARLQKLYGLYNIWKDYAESQKKSVDEVIQEAFGQVLQLHDRFRAFKLDQMGLDGNAIVEVERASKTMKTSFEDLKETLQDAGVDVESFGDITTENFEQIYNAVIHNNPTPQTLDALNRLGDAFLTLAQKAQSAFAMIDAIHAQAHGETIQAPKATDQIKAAVDQALGPGAADRLSQTIGVDWSDPTSIADWLYTTKNQSGDNWTDLSGNPLDKDEFFAKLQPYLPGLQQQVEQSSGQNNAAGLFPFSETDYAAGKSYASPLEFTHAAEANAYSNQHQFFNDVYYPNNGITIEIARKEEHAAKAWLEQLREHGGFPGYVPWGQQAKAYLDKMGVDIDSWSYKDFAKFALQDAVRLNPASYYGDHFDEEGNFVHDFNPAYPTYGFKEIAGHEDSAYDQIGFTDDLKTTILMGESNLGNAWKAWEEKRKQLEKIEKQIRDVLQGVVLDLQNMYAQAKGIHGDFSISSLKQAYEAKKSLEDRYDFVLTLDNFIEKVVSMDIDKITTEDVQNLQRASEYFKNILQVKVDFTKWLEDFAMSEVENIENPIERAKKKAELLEQKKTQADEALEYIRTKLHIADLSKDNFLQYYEEAMAATPTPEELELWSQAKNAIEDASRANQEYSKSLQEVAEAQKNSMNAYWQAVKESAKKWSDYIDRIEEQKAKKEAERIRKVIDAVSEKIGSLQNASSSLQSLIDKFVKPLQSPKEREALFHSFLDLAKTAFAAGNYKDYAEYLQKASGYADYIDDKLFASSKQKRYEMAVVANQLKDLKSPTDQMLEQLQAIKESNEAILEQTTAQKEKMLELVDVKIGGKSFEEITRDGQIQAIKSGDFQAVVGDPIEAVKQRLAPIAKLDTIETADGRMKILADFDRDGVTDMTFAFDQSGKLQGIERNTYGIWQMEAKRLEAVVKKMAVSMPSISEATRQYILSDYTITPEYISTAEGQLAADYYTPLAQAALQYEELLKSRTLDAESAPLYRQLAYEISTYAKALLQLDPEGGQNFGNFVVGLSDQYKFVKDLPNFYADIDQYIKDHGYATGGYTGDIPPSVVAGVVHGQEFVVNAPTTRRLGLNKDNGGVFMEILKELKEVKRENAELRAIVARHLPNVDKNTKKDARARVAG